MARDMHTDNARVFRAVVTVTFDNGTVSTYAYGPYTASGPARRMLTKEVRMWERRSLSEFYGEFTVAGAVEAASLSWETP
jgi:hypothetical protein